MVTNLTPEEIHRFIVEDFKGAWNSVAANPDTSIGRGNFMFARQAMNLLEFGSMLCAGDPSHAALTDFSNCLHQIEPKYFTQLPSPCASTTGVVLPHLGNTSGNLLLWALYDLIRNGLAHQYQQILVQLSDGNYFFITLTGAAHRKYLNSATSSRPNSHLGIRVNSHNVSLLVHPQLLFLDFEGAIGISDILNRNLPFPYFTRPLKPTNYNFNLTTLQNSLVAGGHIRI
jgi:hypothetical protein